MRSDGSFAAVAVVVQQLLAPVDVAGGHEDEVRHAVDVVQLGLAVSVLAVVDQPAQSAALFGGIHAGGRGRGEQTLKAERGGDGGRKRQKRGNNGPVFLAEVLEVVHVAAGGRILSIFRLPLFGVGELQQVAVVLHHVLAFLETPSGKYCSALSFHVLYLQARHASSARRRQRVRRFPERGRKRAPPGAASTARTTAGSQGQRTSMPSSIPFAMRSSICFFSSHW